VKVVQVALELVGSANSYLFPLTRGEGSFQPSTSARSRREQSFRSGEIQ
jgi:hypothetical protein